MYEVEVRISSVVGLKHPVGFIMIHDSNAIYLRTHSHVTHFTISHTHANSFSLALVATCNFFAYLWGHSHTRE